MKNFIKTIMIVLLTLMVIVQFQMESRALVPVKISKATSQENPTVKKLQSIGVKSTEKLVNAIDFASKQNNLSQDLIIAVTWTESRYDRLAVSSKGYNGLMQIPQRVFYEDANVLIGSRILREKIELAKGDMTKALLMYKGYPLDSQRGHEQVKKVYTLYYKLKNVT